MQKWNKVFFIKIILINISCTSVHHIYGDMERLFHPFYFKTTKCMYKTNENGLCKKNGIYCAFSHGSNDFRNLKVIYDGTNIQFNFLTNFVRDSNFLNGKTLSFDESSITYENKYNFQDWNCIGIYILFIKTLRF